MSSCDSEFHEHVLERFVVLQPAQAIDPIVRHHLAVRQDHDVGAHLLDDFDDVRAHQDGAALVGKGSGSALRSINAAATSSPENGSSRMISSGL